jgi:hypothetical protein
MSLVSVSDMAPVVHIDHARILQSLKLNPNDPKTQALLLVCDRYGLDPILKHMVLVDSNPYITRDGLLHVAHRSGVFDGMEVREMGEDGDHWTATVAVYRKDMGRPFVYPGRYPKNGSNKKYAREMALKCAEVMALRRAFDVTGVAVLEEQDDKTDVVYTDSATLPSDDLPVNASTARGRLATQDQADRIRRLATSLTPDEKEAASLWREEQGIDLKSMTFEQAEAVIAYLEDEALTTPAAAEGDAEVIEYGPDEEPFE